MEVPRRPRRTEGHGGRRERETTGMATEPPTTMTMTMTPVSAPAPTLVQAPAPAPALATPSNLGFLSRLGRKRNSDRDRDSARGRGRRSGGGKKDEKLSVVFRMSQSASRFLVSLYEIGVLTFVAWAYARWRGEVTVRVDILFPCFFPLIAAILVNWFEILSLLYFKRRRPFHPVVVCLDIVVAAVGVFCFVAISMSGYNATYHALTVDFDGNLSPRALWSTDVNNVMIFMMVFSLLHAFFLLVAAIGGVYLVVRRKKLAKKELIARHQAEVVQFNERQNMRRKAQPGKPLQHSGP